jgi:hypothetical protein
MLDPLLDSLLEDAMEDAIAEVAEECTLDAAELIEAFGDEIQSNPLISSLFNNILL